MLACQQAAASLPVVKTSIMARATTLPNHDTIIVGNHLTCFFHLRLLFIVYCLLSLVYCLLFIVYCHSFIVYCLLFIVYRCLLLLVYCLLFIVTRLLFIVYCYSSNPISVR